MNKLSLTLGAFLATSSIGCDEIESQIHRVSNLMTVKRQDTEAERSAKCQSAIEEAGKIPFTVDLPEGQWVDHRHSSALYVKRTRDGISRTFDPRKESAEEGEDVRTVFVHDKEITPSRTDCQKTWQAFVSWRAASDKVRKSCKIPEETIQFVDGQREKAARIECDFSVK